MNSKALFGLLLTTGLLSSCLGQYNVGSLQVLVTQQPNDGGGVDPDAGVTLDACAGLDQAACVANSACESNFNELCDCTCPEPARSQGVGCAECSAACFSFAGCSARGAPQPSTPNCGTQTCGAWEFCEIVNSDVPEFNGSYSRRRCMPAPMCDSDEWCLCVQAGSQCKYDTTFVSGIFERQGNACSLTCNVGG